MQRRQLLSGITGAASLGALAPAWPQGGGRVMRLGWLRPNRTEPTDLQSTGIPNALERMGWVRGRNLVIEARSADGKLDRMPALAAELNRLPCDAVIAVGAAAALAMAQETSSVPVVMFGNFDPVARGLVSNLARPGGNLTGVLIAPDGSLAGKRLELLKEAVPRAQRIALLAPADPTFEAQIDETRAAARTLGIDLPLVAVQGRDYRRALSDIASLGARAAVVGAHTSFMSDRQPLIELALKDRLPTCWEWAEQVRDGGLLAYGTSLNSLYERVARYVDRIFKGTRAGDLPVERPATFEVALNLKTARAIGLTIPPAVRLRASEVIE